MPKVKQASKSRGWMITINNIADWDGLQKRVAERKQVRYFCGQLEVGEQSSVRHLQAYVEFNGPVGLAAVRKLFPRCHAEVRRGSPEEAKRYCSKEETRVAGSFFECGECPQGGGKQGAREDLVAVRVAIEGGASVSKLYSEFPVTCAKYPKYVDKCLMLFSARRSWKTEVRVFRGPTGCGKTQLAHELYPDIWVKPDGQWFDGYDRHPHVLIDDFDGGRSCGISYRFLLRLLDRYRLQVPIKGGFKEWVPKVIIITTNVEPRGWYPWEDFAPLERRIDECRTWDT